MKKKIIAMMAIALVSLTALGTIGGTLAYLIDKTQTITNTFELGEITYKLTLDANLPEGITIDGNWGIQEGNLKEDSQTVCEGSAIFTVADPIREGYAFEGWFTDKECTTEYIRITPNTTDDTKNDITIGYDRDLLDEHGVVSRTLFAKWKQMDFVVTFDVNATDATVEPQQKTVTYQQAYGELPVPVRDKYKFVGWTLTKNGEDYVTKDTLVQIAENHTLYAKWVGSHEYVITYIANASNASFNGSAQQVTDTKIQDASYIIKSPTDLMVSRNGYIWTEWNTKADGTGETYLGEKVYTENADLTLYAIWATKTAVTFGSAKFVNMIDYSQTPGANDYNFVIKCKTQGGADGIAIPIHNLIPNEHYRLTFSVTFNNFLFYRDDDGDNGNKSSTSGSYIFGTNIIDQYEDYDSKLSIIVQDGKKTTSKYENMQWSTRDGGHYEVFLDFVPTSSTMYWFWETTDIQDNQLMSYEFNNFNIQNRGPVGPRVEFEDLTVTFQTAPFIDQNVYTWPNATNGTVRHKNYFHTEKFGVDYLTYRTFGYAGHERMSIPISGLTEGQWYELTFTQDLTGAVTYDGASAGQLYGCAVSEVATTSDHYGNSGCVDMMDEYRDLRHTVVGNRVYTTTIKFRATKSTMYWHWTLGHLQDYKWSTVKLSNVSITETEGGTN